jgi:putative redox protein
MVHAKQAASPYRVEIRASGHELVADEPPANGGHNTGPGPFDLVVAGLAACTLITLRMYAERKGWTGFDIASQLRHRMDGKTHFIDRAVEVSGVPNDAGMERLRDVVERTPVTLALKPGFTISTVLTEAAHTPGATA